MQHATKLTTKDTSLKKELLSKAHVSMREDERKTFALDLVMELRFIASSDKRHG